MVEYSPSVRETAVSSHTKDMKIGNLSNQLGTRLDSEIEETQWLSSRALIILG